jgi:hypothetical protein
MRNTEGFHANNRRGPGKAAPGTQRRADETRAIRHLTGQTETR